RTALEAQVRTLGLHDVVDLPGFASDTGPFYGRADIFVLSSDYEGLPTVMIEALEHGVPVVSTDCPSGPREILEDGKYGRLVPVGDVEALAQAMLESLQSSHDHAALKALARDFAVDKIADQYLDLQLPGWRGRGRECRGASLMASGILYIAYDGMLEPLGQSQVLAYLERLAADRPIHLLSFEKTEDWADADARARVKARMDATGIHWHPRRYHK